MFNDILAAGGDGGGSSDGAILYRSGLTGKQTIDIRNDIPFYNNLTADNFLITLDQQTQATNTDSTSGQSIFVLDLYTGYISYSNGILEITSYNGDNHGPSAMASNRGMTSTNYTDIPYSIYIVENIEVV